MASESWYPGDGPRPGLNPSAVSWGAILAGAAAAAALSLILLLLGVGLGLSALSPWANDGAGGKALGIGAIVWLAFTQLAASGVGGYLAGRLRVRWRDTDADEVHFRDTAHGMLAWAVATLFTAAVLTSSVGAVLGIGAQTASAVGKTAATAVAAGAAGVATAGAGVASSDGQADRGVGGGAGDMAYFVDALLRPAALSAGATAADGAGSASAATTGTGAASGSGAASGTVAGSTGAGTGTGTGTGTGAGTAGPARAGNTGAGTAGANPATLRAWPDAAMQQANAQTGAELTRLMVRALRSGGTLSAEDTRYAGQLVAQRTGLSPAEAERRVTDTLQRARTEAQNAEIEAREAADAARKAALHSALWMFVALLLGAFTASWVATVGGRQRDQVE